MTGLDVAEALAMVVLWAILCGLAVAALHMAGMPGAAAQLAGLGIGSVATFLIWRRVVRWLEGPREEGADVWEVEVLDAVATAAIGTVLGMLATTALAVIVLVFPHLLLLVIAVFGFGFGIWAAFPIRRRIVRWVES